jgi:hypothetical protein
MIVAAVVLADLTLVVATAVAVAQVETGSYSLFLNFSSLSNQAGIRSEIGPA